MLYGHQGQHVNQGLPRVLIRLVTSPHEQRGECLVLYVDSRSIADPHVLVYSVTRDEWRVEPHRRIMWRTRRASPTERAVALEALIQIGEGRVRVLQSAPRAIDAPLHTDHTDHTDQSPAFDQVSPDEDGT